MKRREGEATRWEAWLTEPKQVKALLWRHQLMASSSSEWGSRDTLYSQAATAMAERLGSGFPRCVPEDIALTLAGPLSPV